MITAIAESTNVAVTFLDVKGVSVVRFKEFVIDDTGLNPNTTYYNIETGSEVYVAGLAKHPTPYTTPVLESNMYVFPTL
jgi:hypothetical protein